jgi:hypothetical protein
VGSLERRLVSLEERSRERAAARVRAAWEELTNREIALILAPYHFGRAPALQERAAQASFCATVPEPLIAAAVGYQEGMPEEELSRRMAELVEPVTSGARRSGVLRALEEDPGRSRRQKGGERDGAR